MILEKIIEAAKINPNKLYGILLFTERDPIITQMLKVDEYRKSIDLRSGKELDIFASMLMKGMKQYPQVNPDIMSYTIPIWVEPERNKKVLSLFDIEDSGKLPVFVLFGVECLKEVEFSFFS